jgi:ribonuclease HI
MIAPVQFWCDGGVLGKNPSPRGVYWSVAVSVANAPCRIVVSRKKDPTYHSNQDAEWLALREALTYAAVHFAGGSIIVHTDSKFVVNQWADTWRTTIARHALLKHECRRLAAELAAVAVVWRPRRMLVYRLGH